MLENFDPTTIEDETVRQVVFYLMNQVESLYAKVQEQAEDQGEQASPQPIFGKGTA